MQKIKSRFGLFLAIGCFASLQVRADELCSNIAADLAVATKPNIYVVDTNVLHSHPEVLEQYANAHLVIPRTAIQELDRHKSEQSERGQSARVVSSKIRQLMDAHRSFESIPLGKGSFLTLTEVSDRFQFPGGMNRESADDRIVALGLEFKKHNSENEVILITNDNNAAIVAGTAGLKSQRYEAESAASLQQVKDLLAGPHIFKVSDAVIEHLRKIGSRAQGAEFLKSLGVMASVEFYDNQFIVFKGEREPAEFSLAEVLPRIWRYRGSEDGAQFFPIREDVILNSPIQPRNIEQIMFFDLLMDSRVSLVLGSGKAGSGKTLLSMAAGMAQSSLFKGKNAFEKIIITRPYQVTGEEMGFLPGSVDEKMGPFIKPFEDNLTVWIEALREIKRDSNRGSFNSLEHVLGGRGKRGKSPTIGETKLSLDAITSDKLLVPQVLYQMKESGFLSIEPVAFVRGRTFIDTLIVIDEAQNMDRHEAQTFLSRAGKGTKIIMLGDFTQIDRDKMTISNNALAIAATRLRGEKIVGHVNLPKGERSELADLAADKLSR